MLNGGEVCHPSHSLLDISTSPLPMKLRPNRHTLALGAILLCMWYAGAAQQNGGAYLLAFLTAMMAAVSWLHARANLKGLHLEAGVIPPAREGEALRVPAGIGMGSRSGRTLPFRRNQGSPLRLRPRRPRRHLKPMPPPPLVQRFPPAGATTAHPPPILWPRWCAWPSAAAPRSPWRMPPRPRRPSRSCAPGSPIPPCPGPAERLPAGPAPPSNHHPSSALFSPPWLSPSPRFPAVPPWPEV